MPYYIRSKDNDNFLFFLTFIFVVASYIMGTKESGSGILALVTLLFLVFSNFKLEFYPFHFFVFQFCLFCYASSIWAFNYHTALSKGFTIFQILVCYSVMYSHFKRLSDVSVLMKILMWAGYLVVFYSYFFYGVETVLNTEGEGRLGNSFNNINTLSMLASTVVVINLFFIMFQRASKWYFLLIILAVAFVISSQSRKAVAILILGFFFLSYLRYARERHDNLLPILRIVGMILLVAVVLLALSSTSLMEGFFNRMMGAINSFTGEGDLDTSTQVRQELRNLGWSQFAKTPWLGIGMGCAQYLVGSEFGERMYLHDNYVELAVCGGVFGLISYYSIYVYLFVKMFKYWRKDDMALLVLTLVTIKFFTDYGAVSYFAKINYFQLMVYYLHLQTCKQKYPTIK